jgi:hypothetical protein
MRLPERKLAGSACAGLVGLDSHIMVANSRGLPPSCSRVNHDVVPADADGISYFPARGCRAYPD